MADEILAASYAVIRYTPTNTQFQHQLRLYFNTLPTMDGDDGFIFSAYTDDDHPDGYHLLEIVEEIADRIQAEGGGVGEFTVNGAEMWASASGENVFLGVDPASYTGVDGGTGGGVAAAYKMFVFKANNREQFRFNWFEHGTASPQRASGSTPPTIDNGSLSWFIIRSAVGFCTRRGYEITSLGSINTGANDHLADVYGRRITP